MRVTLSPIAQSIRGKSGNLVFQNRQGNQLVTRFNKARNPQTENQEKTRNLFRNANHIYGTFPEGVKQLWKGYSPGDRIVGQNNFVRNFYETFKDGGSLFQYSLLPESSALLGFSDFRVARNVRSVVLILRLIALYPGFEFIGAGGWLIRDIDPTSAFRSTAYICTYTEWNLTAFAFTADPTLDYYLGGYTRYIRESDGVEIDSMVQYFELPRLHD